jgi:hypothetical protein
MGVVLYTTSRCLAPMWHGMKLVPIFRWQAPYLPHSIPNFALLKIVNIPITIRLRLLIDVGLSIALGSAVYLGLLHLLKVQELALITRRVLNKFAAKS